jgi:hypothetical protein
MHQKEMMRFVQGRAAGEAAGGRVVAGAAVYRLWAALADEHDGDGAKKRLFWNDLYGNDQFTLTGLGQT